MSLEKIFSENKLKLCHLKTFGCLSYVHIRHQSRKKLQSRSIMESFVVYDKQTTGYQIYLHNLKKITICRDIFFEETKFIDYDKLS